MKKVFLENARQSFLRPSKDNIYYEGMSLEELGIFIKMLAYIVPNKITADELIVYLKFLTKDIKDGVCRFNNSKVFKEYFEQYISYAGNFEMWMTYLPGFIKEISTPEFYGEFIDLFRSTFYQLESNNSNIQDHGYVEIEKDVIDISNKDKAEVLAALYNHAKPVGMGIVQYDPTPMTKETAELILREIGIHFDYLKGRPMKLTLDDKVFVGAYNRDNDQDGLAQKAISTCRNVNIKKI